MKTFFKFLKWVIEIIVVFIGMTIIIHETSYLFLIGLILLLLINDRNLLHLSEYRIYKSLGDMFQKAFKL